MVIIDMNEHIASTVKMVRKNLGLTQAQLAEGLELSAGHIGSFEQGKTKISYDVMEKFVLKYNIDANLFFGKTRDDKDISDASVVYILDKITDAVNDVINDYRTGSSED